MKSLLYYFVAFLGLVIFANLFFFRETTEFSVALFFVGVQLFIIATAQTKHKSLYFLLLFNIFYVYVILTRGTKFVTSQTLAFIFATVCTTWYSAINADVTFASWSQTFLSPLFAIATYIKNAAGFLIPKNIATNYQELIASLADGKKHSGKTSTALGVLIAIPVAVIFLGLFAAADPIYYSYLKKIFSPEFLAQIPARVIFSILLAVFAIPLVLIKTSKVNVNMGALAVRFKLVRESTIVIFVIALIVASYLLVQWPYVFAQVKAETSLAQFGVATYAEYVTAGFLELLRISALIYAVLWVGLTALRSSNFASRKLLVVQLVLFAEFAVLIASVFRRVYLYIEFHGLTLIRFYGSVFLLYIFALTLTLLGRHFTKRLRFGLIEGIIACLFVAFVGIFNVENHIALYHPPTVNKNIDYVYLSRMSADGFAGWVAAYQNLNTVFSTLQNKKELNKLEIAQAAYGYYSLRNLFVNYENLASAHGTNEQYIDYKVKVAQAILTRLNNAQATEKAKTPVSEQHKTQQKTNLEAMANLTNQIEVYTKNIKTTEPKNLDLKTEISAGMYFELPDYTQTTYEYYSFADASILWQNSVYTYNGYTNSQDKNILLHNALDKLFMSNVSEINAWHKMQTQIPLKGLLDLETKYLQIYKKIMQQKERGYERDISLTSPLI